MGLAWTSPALSSEEPGGSLPNHSGGSRKEVVSSVSVRSQPSLRCDCTGLEPQCRRSGPDNAEIYSTVFEHRSEAPCVAGSPNAEIHCSCRIIDIADVPSELGNEFVFGEGPKGRPLRCYAYCPVTRPDYKFLVEFINDVGCLRGAQFALPPALFHGINSSIRLIG